LNPKGIGRETTYETFGLEGMQSMERSPPQNMADWKGAALEI